MTRRTLAALLLIPALAAAQPGEVCRREHAAIRGRPAPCTGVLSPPQTALDGAECMDALLPRCEALRDRQASVCHTRCLALVDAERAAVERCQRDSDEAARDARATERAACDELVRAAEARGALDVERTDVRAVVEALRRRRR